MRVDGEPERPNPKLTRFVQQEILFIFLPCRSKSLIVWRDADDQLIVAAPMSELKGIDFGAPLHSLVIAGSVHVMEEEMIECFRIRNQPGLKPYTPQLAASDDESGL
eukprot:scaffold13614_cov20-Tisochrysis_lutea.AAC.1